MTSTRNLLAQVRACTICAPDLPHRPRPVVQLDSHAKILIAGQAPGRKVHQTGIAFNDASGERLRSWLGIGTDVFYDPRKIAPVPMGLCFPGSSKGGDLPPRPECAPAWRDQLLAALTRVELTLVIGRYAHDYHFPRPAMSVTERVRAWSKSWPYVVPLPHPSPRNNLWMRRNPWFESELVPRLQERVGDLVGDL